MKIAIVSDTHFGDPASTLVTMINGTYQLGDKYEAFKDAVGEGLDYLVMLGDIFDFSIASYQDAYTAGQIFFKKLVEDGITEKILYLPGNHDADFWHTVEHEVNILMQIRKGAPPRPFRWSVPGVIDFSKDDIELNLPEVEKTDTGYGGLFLDNIAPGLTFTFAYPNLYIKVDDEVILLTHGQYLEPYWCFLSEWLLKIAGKDLQIGESLDLKEMVSLNFPINQLACSGVGQAGKFTDLVRTVQREVKDDNYRRVEHYVEKLRYELDNLVSFRWYGFLKEIASDACINAATDALLKAVKDTQSSRFDEKFISDPDVQRRFHTYLDASLVELHDLKILYDVDLGLPTRMIFGHTHEPIGWHDPRSPRTTYGNTVLRWHNTGGWLMKTVDGQQQFVGAQIFVCDETNGMRSKNIS